jgi:5-(carboxyamino)imidazole ribonucleotide mutase
MGSDSDWKTMRAAAEVLEESGIPYEKRVVSAHRTPDDLFEYAGTTESRGLSLIIAGAGGAAHLPGMTAAKTIVPVVGVPVIATPLNGIDAVLSIMQMPAHIGVATVGVGAAGAKHAGLFAQAALAARDRWQRGLRESASAKVVILAGEESDLQVLRQAEETLSPLGVSSETVIVRGGSSSELMRQAADLEAGGAAVFIVGSTRGIDLAREVARATTAPVLAVPIVGGPVGRVDEFVQPFLDLPDRIATFAVGRPGAINATLFAATIVSGRGSDVWKTLRGMREEQVRRVRAMTLPG